MEMTGTKFNATSVIDLVTVVMSAVLGVVKSVRTRLCATIVISQATKQPQTVLRRGIRIVVPVEKVMLKKLES